jgi:hypothetical protein
MSMVRFEMGELLLEVIRTLETISNKIVDYGNSPIPSEADKEILACMKSYSNLPLVLKMKLKEEISVSVSWLLLCFGERMATLSLRKNNQLTFDMGLLALSIVNGNGLVDGREITLILSLYCDVNLRNSNTISFENILSNDDEFIENIALFLNREKEDKDILVMGYIFEVNELNEFTYKRTW